jgi:SAM-dependent methyltransferase
MTDTQDWTGGYPTTEPYPSFWHGFQSPAHLAVVCALVDVVWEAGPETPLSIADLGCGTAYTATALAASNPHWRVLGLDYNPAHVAEARSLGAAAGLGTLDVREADLSALSDAELDALPEFDIVQAHGLWSWIADPVRDGVLRLIRRRLKPGGLVLLTYNARPGAAGAMGLARLARAAMRAAPDSVAGTAALTEQVRALVEAQAPHLPASGWRDALLDKASPRLSADYLLHEFATDHWRPAFHADVAAAMATVRCDYVGSATLGENFPQMTLDAAQLALWRAAPDEAARQLLTDLCVQRAFRRDVFVRGLRRLPRGSAAGRIALALADWSADPVSLRTQAGIAELPAPIIEAVRTRLRAGPALVAELCALPPCAKVTPAEMLCMLVASGFALPVWRRAGEGPGWAEAVAASRRLNAATAPRLAPHGTGRGKRVLAAPMLGGGLTVENLGLALSQIIAAGAGPVGTPAELADRLLPPGAQLPPEIRTDLEAGIAKLLRDDLPAWQAFGIV